MGGGGGGDVTKRRQEKTADQTQCRGATGQKLKMDLSFLQILEKERVLEVLWRDKHLRTIEEDRIRRMKGELQELRRKGAKSYARQYGERTCARCQRPLGKLWNTGAVCRGCSHRICSRCRVGAANWKCTVCHRVLGLPLGLLPAGRARKTSPGRRLGGILTRCPSHLNWLLRAPPRWPSFSLICTGEPRHPTISLVTTQIQNYTVKKSLKHM
uniref:RabBD domain-containing protein n=1 Tax=Nothobranchius furzeri TaxID=105023 RepID=A0A8C6P4X4_NOTFU